MKEPRRGDRPRRGVLGRFQVQHIKMMEKGEHVAWGMAQGCTAEEAGAHWEEMKGCVRFVNDKYVVLVRKCPEDMNPMGVDGLVWLSIRRTDRRPVRNWAHIQEIKNAVLGEEGEAVEMFPAQSRVVGDCGEVNQYHLFGTAMVEGQPGVRYPMGFGWGMGGSA